MKKILSAALALVCVWFATPAFANCNLYPHSDTSITASWAISSSNLKTFLNTLDVGTYSISFDIELLTRNDVNDRSMYGIFFQPSNTLVNPAKVSWGTSPVGTTRYVSRTFNITNENKGNITNVFLYGCGLDSSGATGSAKFTNIKIERGSTATPYQPYNPLCATCDGTVVNYVSATGTVSQSGTPTPDNPIDPVFYQQGNMILRAVGDVADSYDATTGKITRRIGVKVFDGTEAWTRQQSTYNNKVYYRVLETLSGAPMSGGNNSELSTVVCNILPHKVGIWYKGEDLENGISGCTGGNGIAVSVVSTYPTVNDWTSYLAQQYAAGTPVTVYYPLATEVVEDWTETSYCFAPIKIATTKYNESAFSPLNTALQNAISVVDTVVSNTITQAASIATLQAQKQTRPNDIADDNEKCPAGKKCLLVEDASGIPHWYEIVENAWDLPAGYTQLEYIESTGTQWINTGNVSTGSDRFVSLWNSINANGNRAFYAASNGSIATGERSLFWMDSAGVGVDVVWPTGADTGKYQHIAGAWGASGDYLFDDNLTSFTYNGTSVSRSVSRNFTSRYNLFLFAVSRNGVDPIAVSIVRLKYFKWYRNDELIHEYIPAKNPDGKIGMYDKVSGEFFENKGTGDFVAGPVVQ